MSTTITPIDAANSVGLDPYELAIYLRTEAQARLEKLAVDIRRGGESKRGDVDQDEYDAVLKGVWNLVEAAKACDAHWQAEIAKADVDHHDLNVD